MDESNDHCAVGSADRQPDCACGRADHPRAVRCTVHDGLLAGQSDHAGIRAAASRSHPGARENTVLRLYRGQPGDNEAFACSNLLPGDAETKYFRVQVSHKAAITVHYHADIRPGYEKLAEVLKVRIVLLTTGHTLYDGLMRDMPKQLSSPLSGSGTDELHYEITAYLDTSVGNDYQNKDLIADFRWWVEETGNLGPKTGDSSGILLWIAAAAVSGAVCIFLIISHKRKEGKQND